MAKQQENRNDGVQEMNEQELDKVVGGQSVPYVEWEGPLYGKVRCSSPGCKNRVMIDVTRESEWTAKCNACKRREEFYKGSSEG